MTELERRYRAVLRLLPQWYRERWEEDMVATFLAGELGRVEVGNPFVTGEIVNDGAVDFDHAGLGSALDDLAEARETAGGDVTLAGATGPTSGTGDVGASAGLESGNQSAASEVGDPATLDQAEYAAEFGRPALAEVASVAALALRLRLGGGGAPERSLAVGAGVRVAVLGGLLVLAAPSAFDFFAGPWLVAFLFVLFGRFQAGRAAALVGVASAAVSAVRTTVEAVGGAPSFVVSQWVAVLLGVGLVLGISAFHEDEPARDTRPWLVALAVALGAAVLVMLVGATRPDQASVLDWPAVSCVAWYGLALVPLFWPPVHGRPVTLALALLGAAVSMVRLATALDLSSFPGSGGVAAAALIEGVVVLVVAVLVSVWALRALPPRPGVRVG
ncbi:hypothetical protein [Amycolatopsis sp. NPDC050768]|uniref:hypothetical protein n=1 Tax=Amycolatopsis sp. NPDC050768 TaxID=3154839 RepID=UPI0033C9F98E